MKLAETPEERRKWMEQWRLAEKILEEVKCDEMRDMSDSEALRAAHDLLSFEEKGWREPERELSLGLIEQQRLFQKAAAQGKL